MIEIIKHGKYFNQYHYNCDVCGCEWIGGLIDKCKSDVCSCPECGHTTLEMYTKMMSKGLQNENDDERVSAKDNLSSGETLETYTNTTSVTRCYDLPDESPKLQKTNDEWISVNDHLPDKDDVVVVTNNELSYKDRYADVYTAIYKYNDFYDWSGNEVGKMMIGGPVTHWRKAVELPGVYEAEGD